MKALRTLFLFVLGVLVLAWGAIAVSNKARLFVAKNYFKHEVPDWTPKLARYGILRPVRWRVEPSVSLNLDSRDLVSLNILRSRMWQPEVWDSLNGALPEGGVLLDVGAHIGYFSLKGAAKTGPKGRVVAFEPNPETLVQLRSNIEASEVSGIVTVSPIACSDREGELTLWASRDGNTGASSLSKDNAAAFDTKPEPYKVRARPIDDVVRELGLTRVDAIKVDVEGAEVMVLRGAIQTLKRFHPRVVAEVDERQLAGFGTKPADLDALFAEAGYNHSKKIDESDVEWIALTPDKVLPSVKAASPATESQLVSGFYGLEGNWRWTGREFTMVLGAPSGAHSITLDVTVPQALLDKIGGSTTLHARIGKVELTPQTYRADGAAQYKRDLPESAVKAGIAEATFWVEKTLAPTAGDPRELGIIFNGASVQ